VALRILHTNDLHGKLDAGMARRLASVPRDLFADTGDLIQTGNLGVPLRPDSGWSLLAEAGCDVGTIGNRESHLVEAVFRMKVEGCRHPLVCANFATRDGRLVFPPSKVFERAGLRIGLIGAMAPIVTTRMKSRYVSAYLWSPPIPVVAAEAGRLRSQVDVLIALTHLGLSVDRELARACPSLDVILGGHCHSVLATPERIGNTWICQGGSHGRFFGRYTFAPGRGMLDAELVPLRAG
jgi:2',3'-cyclic-nucleotide 2'-phosphodiesterase (5'-nucleotidase family)